MISAFWRTIMLVVLIFNAGCKGGYAQRNSGSSSNANATHPPVDLPGIALGVRNLPGYALAVNMASAAQPGRNATFFVKINAVSSTAELARVEAGVVSGFDPNATLTELSQPASSADPWVYSTRLTDPLDAAARVLIRVSLADGSLQESGPDDFIVSK